MAMEDQEGRQVELPNFQLQKPGLRSPTAVVVDRPLRSAVISGGDGGVIE